MYRYTKLSVLAIAIAATGAVALAATGSTENDAMRITQAKIPLTQAAAVAEQHANGKASRAEYENSNQGWICDVEVVSGRKVFDVRVDADKGTCHFIGGGQAGPWRRARRVRLTTPQGPPYWKRLRAALRFLPGRMQPERSRIIAYRGKRS